MKKQLLKISLPLLSLIFLTLLSAKGQIINDNVNIQVKFVQGWGQIANDPSATAPPDQTWIARAAQWNNNVFSLFNQTPGANNSPNYCYQQNLTSNTWGSVVADFSGDMGTILNSPTRNYRWEVFSWEDDEAPRCTYNSADENAWSQTNVTDLSSSIITASQWTQLEHILAGNNTRHRQKYTWRYTNGFSAGSPLDFGNLNGLESHINTNRGPATGAAATQLGYANTSPSGGSFKSGNDVWYKFTVGSGGRNVTMSTDHSDTNFDTVIHLVTFNSNNTVNYIASNDDVDYNGGNLKSILVRDLCQGEYGVIVEGFDSGYVGNFKLSIEETGFITTTGGAIRIESANGPQTADICPNAPITAIANNTPPTFPTELPAGPVTYTWEKRVGIGNWTTISGSSSSNTSSNLGTMSNASSISFRRKATNCFGSNYSNVVTFFPSNVTANPGTITGNQEVPYPQELPYQELGSQGNASATPSPIITWEKDEENEFGGRQGWNTISGVSSQTYTPPSNSITTTTYFRRKVESSCGTSVSDWSNEVKVTVNAPNGIITGTVTDRNGVNGIQGITITALRTSSPPPGGQTNKTYTAVTGNGGTFSISAVYYGDPRTSSGDTATFMVTPSRAGHGFDPDMTSVTVRQTDPQPPGLTFKDTTGFLIAGKVTQECWDCESPTLGIPVVYNLPNVTILESANPNQPNVPPINNFKTTAIDGTYATIKNFQGDYIIKPEYETHQFYLDQDTVSVGGSNGVEVLDVNFKDTTTHVITGNVVKNCNPGNYIGQTVLTFSQVLEDENGDPITAAFVKNVTTGSTGAYSIRLPAAKYKVSVGTFFGVPANQGLDPIEMTNFLNAYPDSVKIRDITNADTTLNLIFHESPQIAVSGLEITGLCDASGIGAIGMVGDPGYIQPKPIFVQGEEREFTVFIYEGDPNKGCIAADSSFIITTNIEGDTQNESIDTLTSSGKVTLSLKGGTPNIIAPHHKVLTFNFVDIWKRPADNLVLTPVVTGVKAREGNFTTVTPQLPMLILRDPPGDKSSSFWGQSNTIQTSNRFYEKVETEGEIWGEVQVGVETETGIGVSVESAVWGIVSGSLTTAASVSKSRELTLTTTTSETFSTSDESNVTGADGDVYIGAAINLKYAVSDELTFSDSTCDFSLEKFLMIANDSLATKYVYSESHIVNTLIPELIGFSELPSTTPKEKMDFLNQVKVWQQLIENNKELKRKAKFNQNISFDGATGPITSSTSSTSSSTSTIEFDLFIAAAVATELGIEVAGAGASAGAVVTLKMETGESKVTTNSNTTTTGFILDDDDTGDLFSVDVKTDPVYGTPVFDLVAGTSSCPPEPGTRPRDEISLTIANPILTNIPANGTGIFELKIGNTSQSEEQRTYWLRYINSSSNGATISKDGNPFIIPFVYNLPYLNEVPVSVGVTRFNPNVYGFENIRFEAIDGCQGKDAVNPYTRKEVSISAFFANGCSPITLSQPENGFVVNQASANILPITMADYVYANLDEVTVEYTKVGTSNWTEAVTYPKAALLNSQFGTQKNLNVTNLSDGNYNFRLKLKCGLDVVYSQRVSGIIDRTGPASFGVPQPSDDVYAIGDEISQSFNEVLACSSINANNFTMTRMSNNTAIPAVLGCFNNKIVLTPTIDLLQYLGDSIKVDLVNISDKYGNPSLTDYTWEFNIGSQEIDDSIPFFASMDIPVGTSSTSSAILSTPTSINEDEPGALSVNFSVNQSTTDSILVYFIVAGTATFGVDYTVLGAHQYNGNEGAIYIPKNATNSILSIVPTADTEEELDESIILGILSGGDYNIGGSNKVTLTIVNDDVNDCENGGLLFVQNNNSNGNTTLEAGEYHKSLLESDGLVQSPTTVIFKGERSITLKPGFEVQNGSVFLAVQEDCPNTTTANNNGNNGGEKGGRLAASITNTPVKMDSYLINNYHNGFNDSVKPIGKDGKVSISFPSAIDQQFEIKLLSTQASTITKYKVEESYKKGMNSYEINTNDIKPGVYFLKFTGDKNGEVNYHRLIVNN